MISKSGAEYLRRTKILNENVNNRESGRIRYQNQSAIAVRQGNEPPGMEDYVVFQPNLKTVKGLSA